MPVGPQNPMKLLKDRRLGTDMFKHAHRGNHVEGSVIKWQFSLGVRLNKPNVRKGISLAALQYQTLIQIYSDAFADPVCYLAQKAPGTAPVVEDRAILGEQIHEYCVAWLGQQVSPRRVAMPWYRRRLNYLIAVMSMAFPCHFITLRMNHRGQRALAVLRRTPRCL